MNATGEDRGGQALVEFALVAPLLLLLLLAIISFGLLFGWKHVLNNGAREGARAGAVCKTDDEITDIVRRKVADLPHAGSVQIAIQALDTEGNPLPAGARQRGGVFTVTLTYSANVILIPGILPGLNTLVSRASFRMECDGS